jgi:isopenicillin N synthase-like dioxygenase
MSVTTSPVPLIDISGFTQGDEDRARVVREVRDACERIGFFLVAGHGVPEELVSAAYSDARNFFDQPLDEKLKIERPSPDVSRGYFGVAQQHIASTMGVDAPPDLHEALTFGPFGKFAEAAAGSADAVHFAPNLWPDTPASLQAHVEDYYTSMMDLASRIMEIFALALELPQDYFADKTNASPSNLRFINYPDQEKEPEPGQLRAAEHTDFGTVTILKVEDAPGGLQVRDVDGGWHNVGHVPGAFVVNIGDAMARWTNDKWVSTIHRVVNPPRDQALGSRRISIPFFHSANHDTVIECLATCREPGAEPKYEPITAGQHWLNKTRAMRVGKVERAS